jgi:hypothetical protein
MERKQATFYKTMAIPTFTYSSEIWTPKFIKKKQQKEIAEIKLFRNVAVYTLKDQIKNTVVINDQIHSI